MTTAGRRDAWSMLSLGRLLTTTAIILAATAFWLISLKGDGEYASLATGAWTTLAFFWALFAVRSLRRGRPA